MTTLDVLFLIVFATLCLIALGSTIFILMLFFRALT